MLDITGSSGDRGASSDQQFGVAAPQIALPKGGGALHGIGEKFAANPVTGTGTLSVPIAVSPGRAGFSPQLALSYDSGAGNGPFGLGWSLSLPGITRRTDKGLPTYQDDDESDVFILSGAEDLAPVLTQDANGKLQRQATVRDGYAVTPYRPRIEGLFSVIERWTRKKDGDTFWRSISKDNVTAVYGKTAESRVADPSDPRRVFRADVVQGTTWGVRGQTPVIRAPDALGKAVSRLTVCPPTLRTEQTEARGAVQLNGEVTTACGPSRRIHNLAHVRSRSNRT